MEENKPLLLLNKYHSILLAAIIVETAAFLVSLTDTIVAGNAINADALGAVGLMAPFFSISTFITATINSGAVLNFSEQVGQFHKKRAQEYFSQGVFLSVIAGAVFTAVLMILKTSIIHGLNITDNMVYYFSDYYDIIIFYFLLSPISALLDNIVVADGGEKLSATANIIQIIGNVVLSVILSGTIGVRGIAIATVLFKVIFIIIIIPWFFTKKSSVRIIKVVHASDCMSIVKRGVVRASTFAMTAVSTYLLNAFVLYYFDDDTLQILVLAEKIIGLSSLFLGLSMAIQPIIGTLRGEKNTKAARFLLKRASRDMVFTGVGLSLLLIIFAPYVVRLFGLNEPELIEPGTIAVYITAATLIFSALLVFFFITFFLLHKYTLAIIISAIKDLLIPCTIAILLSVIMKDHVGVWTGISAAAVLSFALSAVIVFLRYGKDLFPFLISKDNDENIHIFAFDVNNDNAIKMSQTVTELLSANGYSKRLQLLAAVYTEDILMLIKEKNPDFKKKLIAEYTLLFEENRVRIILRDTGVVFDITDEDARIDSFRNYTVANMMISLDYKAYMVTTGYNRNEFLFEEQYP